jgi:hypothetical protein
MSGKGVNQDLIATLGETEMNLRREEVVRQINGTQVATWADLKELAQPAKPNYNPNP